MQHPLSGATKITLELSAKDLDIYIDTLLGLFNSLMSRKTSLLFEINSLFLILGNSEKKHR